MGLPDPDNSRAVLVGTARYEADPGLDDLPSVANNLTDLRETLCRRSVGGLHARHCVVLLDPDSTSELAIEIDRVAKGASDLLLVYYAGHGLLDDDGALHLGLTRSTREFTRYDSFPFEGLRRILAKSPARKRVLILDCCFSGQAVGMMGEATDIATGQLDVSGTYTLTATSSTRPAHAPPGARFTAFTDQLLNVLRNGIPQGPEMLDLMSIYLAVRSALAAAGLPEPQQRGTNTAPNLFLVRNAAWVPPSAVVNEQIMEPAVVGAVDEHPGAKQSADGSGLPRTVRAAMSAAWHAHQRRAFALVAALMAVAGGVMAVALSGGSRPSPIGTVNVQKSIGIAAEDGRVWVGTGDGMVIPIDDLGHLGSSVDVGYQRGSVAVGNTGVWALDNSGSGALSYIDSNTPTSPTSIVLRDKPACVNLATRPACAEVAAGDGGAWVTDPARGQLDRIGASVTEERPPLSHFAFGVKGPVAFGGGKIWLLSLHRNRAGHSVLYAVDPNAQPRSAKGIAMIDLGVAGASSVAYGERAVWVGDSLTNELLRVDPGTQHVERIPISTHVSDRSGTVAVGGGSAWVLGPFVQGSDGVAALVRVNPRSNRTTVVPPQLHIDGVSRLAVSNGAAWVTGDARVTRVAFRQQSGTEAQTPATAAQRGPSAVGKLRVVLIPASSNTRVGESISVRSEIYDSSGQLGNGQCVLKWTDRASSWNDTTECNAATSEPGVSKAGVHRIDVEADGTHGTVATGKESVEVTVRP